MSDTLPPMEERYEVIDGLRYDMQPSLTLNHQLILTELWNAIHTHAARMGQLLSPRWTYTSTITILFNRTSFTFPTKIRIF